MAKAKKQVKKLSKFNFSKTQMILAIVFVLGFGGFGVYKLAFSSAATEGSGPTWHTVKSASGSWKITYNGSNYITAAQYNITAGRTYRSCVVAHSTYAATAQTYFDIVPTTSTTGGAPGPTTFARYGALIPAKSTASRTYCSPQVVAQKSISGLSPFTYDTNDAKTNAIITQAYWQQLY